MNHPAILRIVGRIRRKLQLERLVQGLAWSTGLILPASVLGSYLLTQANFSTVALFSSRFFLATVVVFSLLRFLVLPQLRRPSKRLVARFLEERHPQLQDRLSTAVELARTATSADPLFRELVVRDAQGRLRALPQPRLYQPTATRVALLILALSSLVFAWLFWAGPPAYSYSLARLVQPGGEAKYPSLYSIRVTPGNTTVGKRTDVEVRANLQGFDSDKVRLWVKYRDQLDWAAAAMQTDDRGNQFRLLLFDVREALDYYVQAEGIRSETYRIQVAEIPRVEKLKIILDFPAYTWLSDQTLLDQGDIRALEGTRAELWLQADQPVAAGKIKLENEGEISLQAIDASTLRGNLLITQDDFYRIHLQDGNRFWNPASDEYSIRALTDGEPTLSFTRPGRDLKVTNIEEVFTELKAEDDHGLARLNIVFSVNGDEERSVRLDTPRGARFLFTSHTFFLEEFGLEPGDFVSYYAEASDTVSKTVTDLYFLEVQPYDRAYYQSQQSGAPGSDAEQDPLLLRQQKQLIAATFNLVRERDAFSAAEFQENSQTLGLAQQRLQAQAQTIVDRISRRNATAADPRFQRMAEHLKQAITHMTPAYERLNQQNPGEALPQERRSFQQLLRAESFFKDIQVAFSQGQGGSSASAQELADLVDLELDRTKNQYETLQQSWNQKRGKELDEAMEKLKELAKRQQQLAQRRPQPAAPSTGSGGGQQQLLEELEKLRRHLERLSRQQQDERLKQIASQLKRAGQNMRKARNSTSPESQMQASQASERLQDARKALHRQRREQHSKLVRELAQASRELVQKEDEVIESIAGLKEQFKSGRVTEDFLKNLRRLLRDKSKLQEDLHGMEGQLHQSARQLSSQQPDASQKLKGAALEIRNQRLPEKMQEGSDFLARGWMDIAEKRERSVREQLRELAQAVQEAEHALGSETKPGEGEKLQAALGELTQLLERLESLGDRATAEQSSRRRSPEGEEPASRSDRKTGNQTGRGKPESQTEETSEIEATMGSASEESGSSGNQAAISPEMRGAREWKERLLEAQQLQGMLRGHLDLGQDVAGLIREMERLDLDRLFSNPEEVARLRAQIVGGLRQLELDINLALRGDRQDIVRLASDEEPPPGFQEEVEEYYRTLSTGGKPQDFREIPTGPRP